MNVKKPLLRELAKFVGLSLVCFFALQLLYVVSHLVPIRTADVYLHDTYFIVSKAPHLTVLMIPGASHVRESAILSVYCAGLYCCWPKVTGHVFPKALLLILFIGFSLTFFPQLLVGLWSVHRRYHAYPPEFMYLNIVSTVGTTITALGLFFPLFYLLWSLKYGSRTTRKP